MHFAIDSDNSLTVHETAPAPVPETIRGFVSTPRKKGFKIGNTRRADGARVCAIED